MADMLDECPHCKRKPWATNHVPGHIFVGWGMGWQPCNHCGATGVVPRRFPYTLSMSSPDGQLFMKRFEADDLADALAQASQFVLDATAPGGTRQVSVTVAPVQEEVSRG